MPAFPETQRGSLPITGERTVPHISHENYWFRRHEAAYLAARDWLAAAAAGAGPVLDVGVGEGYGAALLAEVCDQVIGLDYDPTAAAHAAVTYPQVNVARGNAVELPFRDGAFGAVVSMQVVEHVWDPAKHIVECARVLRPGGTLVISTPNRLTFSPGYDPATGSPANLFHTREYADAELAELVSPHLTVTARLGLRAGPRLREVDRESQRRHGADLANAQLAAPPEKWPAWLRHTVAAVRHDDFVLSAEDVDSSLDLVIRARNGG